MLHTYRETKYNFLLLLQPNQIKFKQQRKITKFRYESSDKER